MSLDNPPLRVAFRTDASTQIGIGHVMRCLALADHLRQIGADCVFLCRTHEGNLLDLLTHRGHRTLSLPIGQDSSSSLSDPAHASWVGASWESDAQDSLGAISKAFHGALADWLVVDHYGLDARWEEALRKACIRLMAIDDLADRPHNCDILLDQSLGRQVHDYADLAPGSATFLLGPNFAPMRPEFAATRPESLARRENPKLERLLVTLGGVDKDNVTTLVLDMLDASTLPASVKVTVVMGPTAPWIDAVLDRAARMRCTTDVRVGVRDVARLMSESDLAIGAGGTTNWERCVLGLPSLMLTTAENQTNVVRHLNWSGAAIGLGDFRERKVKDQLVATVDQFVANPLLLQGMSRAAAKICDGEGAERVVDILRSFTDKPGTPQRLRAI
ncbi:UDP-2,4-diacetamido-2,4,6-trideoxy-beta-L-altropyranose hydrolase [Sulfitobacter sp. 1A16787]|uniref:UDP-2,4-diacetamido-2,4, 6-trideoxy-beta-L-altropyranose hydrolase n=1 Tax=Sulfitobacter sp. 1A16787 TaxID=3368571 RepID=UPI003746E120